MPLVFKDQIFTKPIHNEVEAFLKVLFEFSCSNNFKIYFLNIVKSRVSVQGVESLWGDCSFIPVDWGS